MKKTKPENKKTTAKERRKENGKREKESGGKIRKRKREERQKGKTNIKIPSEQTVQTVSLLLYNPFFVINRFCIRKITVNFHLQTGWLS